MSMNSRSAIMSSYPPKSYAPRHPSPLSSPPSSPAIRPAGSPNQIQELNRYDNIVTYFLNDANQKHGLHTIHTRKGKILEKNNYKDGILEGCGESYYDNGKLMSLYNFASGHLHGDRKRWAPGGQLLSHERYVGGKLEGLQESWYISGQLWERHFMRNGLYNGKYEVFDSSGNTLEEYNYKEGKLHGVSLIHIGNGCVREMIYNYGTVLRTSVKKMEDMTFDFDVLATL